MERVGPARADAAVTDDGVAVKTKDLRKMNDEELSEQLAESREELFNLRFQDATGALDNTAQLSVTKRQIARILTVQTEREHGLERG